MRKYFLIPAFFFTVIIISCSKKDSCPAERSNPEGRNQEGTKLLGVSRVWNDQVQWSTIYYVPNSNRIAKMIDSAMVLSNPGEAAFEETVVIYDYDANGKLTDLHTGNTLTHFVYDVNGRIIQQISMPQGTIHYAYDQNGRIAEDSSFNLVDNRYENKLRFTYDPAGNVLSEEEWNYDASSNGLVKIATSTFIYDDKLSPYSGIDQNSFIFQIAPHNIAVTTSSSTTGNIHLRPYTYTYNSFGLPASSTFESGIGMVTDKYYYY